MPVAPSNERRPSTDNPASRDSADSPAKPSAEANWWDYCPNCSAQLVNHGCKYRCPDCHYFMSCSDFD
jgi:hypothetical protein